MWIIFGLDIDDCLATEFFLYPVDGGYQISFVGDIYNDIKGKITQLTVVHPGAHFIISTFSARQSLSLDSLNSASNSTILSSQLLYSLAKQLAEELQIDIQLDQTWLADLIPGQPSFSTALNNPMMIFSGNKASRCDTKNVLEQSGLSGYLTPSEVSNPDLQSNQQYLKLVRVRQMIGSAITYYKVPLGASIELFLYDDRQKYLDGIRDMFAMAAVNVIITTLLTNPYYRDKDDAEWKLNRNVITELPTFDGKPRVLKNNFQVWNHKIELPKPATYRSVTQASDDLVLPQEFIRLLELNTQRLIAHLKSSLQQGLYKGAIPSGHLIPKGKTFLASQADDGFSWGTPPYPAYCESLKDKA